MTDEHEYKYNPDNIKLTINVDISKRWVPAFLGFLNKLSLNSDIGHSSLVAFYADGDGNFRFKVDMPIKDNKEFLQAFSMENYKGEKVNLNDLDNATEAIVTLGVYLRKVISSSNANYKPFAQYSLAQLTRLAI